ncbi:MAG: dNTP triphosphohydrolase, partial [Chloroflexi bacterium]|nr:dNTP triphosphohydrolase [Chloroflexota bacterium]
MTSACDLSRLSTADASPWADRVYPEPPGDPRGSYQRDRDRILHSDSFHKLQHKTQVFVVHEGDFFRTRLTHSLEVAQIGRSIASLLKLNEPLVEAICLAHDLGHAPFGHAGESALSSLLAKRGATWNANAYSLTIVEDVETQYCGHRGLNLTFATREGIARHSTRFDTEAKTAEYQRTGQPSLEAQVANIADIIAYSTHDVEDALAAGL